MRRKLALLLTPLALCAIASGALLPDTIGHWQKGALTAAAVPDSAVWQEYGLQESEKTTYSDAGKSFDLTAYRFTDATGAMAAFDQLRPADAKPVELMGMTVQNEKTQIVAAGTDRESQQLKCLVRRSWIDALFPFARAARARLLRERGGRDHDRRQQQQAKQLCSFHESLLAFRVIGLARAPSRRSRQRGKGHGHRFGKSEIVTSG